MDRKHQVAQLSPSLRISYLDCAPGAGQETKGTILLIHGFPQSSYQYRRVLPLLAQSGYRCIAPNYRGIGASSRPASDFRKTTMADDMFALLDHLGLVDPIHVLGHDIGGMIAYAMASRRPERLRSVCWGECHLPGTQAFTRDCMEPARIRRQFHFVFHSVGDLPEALVAGREKVYVMHFFRTLTHNLDAFTKDDMDYYAMAYSQPGALRCAFEVYRAFEEDARDNLEWIGRVGKCAVPTLVLSGDEGWHKEEAEAMAKEVTEEGRVEVGLVKGAGHYLAEENPEGFVEVVVKFVKQFD